MTSEDPPARKAVPPEDAALPACPHAASAPLDRDGHVVRVRSVQTARAILQERHRTRQAGFTAEFIPQGVLRHHPILMSDGPLHDEQRRKTARFFAPAVIAAQVSSQYGLVALGQVESVVEQVYAITTERRMSHPATVAISRLARDKLFARGEGGRDGRGGD